MAFASQIVLKTFTGKEAVGSYSACLRQHASVPQTGPPSVIIIWAYMINLVQDERDMPYRVKETIVNDRLVVRNASDVPGIKLNSGM